jgi:hypothetical protein
LIFLLLLSSHEESDDELVQLSWKKEIVDDDALFLDRSDAIEWFLG